MDIGIKLLYTRLATQCDILVHANTSGMVSILGERERSHCVFVLSELPFFPSSYTHREVKISLEFSYVLVVCIGYYESGLGQLVNYTIIYMYLLRHFNPLPLPQSCLSSCQCTYTCNLFHSFTLHCQNSGRVNHLILWVIDDTTIIWLSTTHVFVYVYPPTYKGLQRSTRNQ